MTTFLFCFCFVCLFCFLEVSYFIESHKDPVLTIILHTPLLLSLFAQERGFYCFPGFCFSRGKHSIVWKDIITSRASGLFKLAIFKYILKCCLINKVHEYTFND